MHYCRYTIVVAMTFLVISLGMDAQSLDQIQLYNSTAGLSNNNVNDICLDSRGFIWFATDDGLNRFDGYEFLVMRPDLYDSLSIASGRIFAILEGSNGDLWLATEKGISRYIRKENAFINHFFYPYEPGALDNKIYDISFSNDSVLWCLGDSTLIEFNISSSSFTDFSLSSDVWEIIIDETSKLEYDEIHDMLYIGSVNGLVYVVLNEFGIFPAEECDCRVNDIFIDQEANVWIGTSTGLKICDWNEETAVLPECKDYLSGLAISSIINCDHDHLLLGAGSRVLTYDENDRRIIRDEEHSIINQEVFSEIQTMLYDGNDQLWLATIGGVYQVNMRSPDFSYYNSTSRGRRLSFDMISSILKIESYLLAGSWGGGLEMIDLESNERFVFSQSSGRNYFPENGVNFLFKDSKNRVWVLGDAPYIFNLETQLFTNIDIALDMPELHAIRGSRINEMIEFHPGEYIIAHEAGFYILSENSRTLKDIKSVKVGNIKVNIGGITSAEYDDNYLWIGCSAGVIHYDLHGKDHQYYPTASEAGPVESPIVLKKDSKGRLWVGTPYGLFRFIEEANYFYGYSVTAGLANDYIYSIEEDESGRLWLGTNKGIICFNPENNDIRNFAVQQGLSCMEFNQKASFYSREEGLMYFGGITGVNFFHPDSVLLAKSPANVELTGIRILRREEQYYSPYVNSVCEIRDDEGVQILFSAIDFTNPENKYYQYRLSSRKTSGTWNQIGNENGIVLSGLNYGNYTLEVLGKTGDSDWSTSPAILEIKVSAPFYRRKFFMVIMFLPLVVLGFFLFEYRTKTLRNSNKALREKEIAAKEVLRQKDLLSLRNKGIEDSLRYAQRIQYAMFTSEIEIKKMFSESFILARPKDIVSGDFYWANKIGSKVFIAAADCTGHGVPGAFMSLIGLEFFRQIVGKQGVHDPGKILDEINKNFDLIFENEQDLRMRDGMDLSLCVIETTSNTLKFAGAFNPLYVIRKGELIEIKADKFLLGPNLGYGRDNFNTREFDLEQNDALYMFSDGYADQFGGPEGKKFKYRRFRHLLLSIYDQPIENQQRILENSMLEWQGENEQVDDILVMGFKPVITI